MLYTYNESLNNWKNVYFIQEGENRAIKIGSADDVNKRIKELQTGNSDELTLLHATTGGFTLETHLRKRFKKYHKRGEWYYSSEELLNFINELKEEDEYNGQILPIVKYLEEKGFDLKKEEWETITLLSRGGWLKNKDENYKIRYWKMLDSYTSYLNKFPQSMKDKRLISVMLVEGFSEDDIKIRERLGMPTRPYYL